MPHIQPLTSLSSSRFETPSVLKKLASASRKLAELKGIAASIPRQGVLINTLGMQEAKDSSAIENIVTTYDEIYKGDLFPDAIDNPATKEVSRYRHGLRVGFDAIKTSGLLTSRNIIDIQARLEMNEAGFRKLPGTVLKDGDGRTIYTPPQDFDTINSLMSDLERFIIAV